MVLAAAVQAQAKSWYWPFDFEMMGGGSDQPRLSELMEPATTNIDAAADYAAEGKFREAQDCYRAAIAALNKIEADNPERAATPEFATVRNKRAYVNAALDSMLLAEARDNAKAVSVTDTTALEVRLAMKPWQELQPTYEALTNADRLVTKRLTFANSSLAHALFNAVTDPKLQVVCVSNCTELGKANAYYAAQREEFEKAYRSASAAVSRMERFSGLSSSQSARVFDVCRKDVRAGISACKTAWPKVREALERLVACLDALRAIGLETAAKKDFPEIAKAYADKVPGRKPADASALVEDLGCLRACMEMQDELNAAGAGVVYTGCLYQIHAAWGEANLDVPQKEDDRGLVKNEGDDRPKLGSQVEEHVERERKRVEKMKKSATKSKTKTAVQREAKELMKKDPKSRRARMLLAGEDLRSGDTAAAKAKVRAILDEKPGDGPALNMRAAIEAAEGDLTAAERTLDQAIQSNPRDYHAYYNMANVYIQKGNLDSARRYYETGRAFAGPKDEGIEKAVGK